MIEGVKLDIDENLRMLQIIQRPFLSPKLQQTMK